MTTNPPVEYLSEAFPHFSKKASAEDTKRDKHPERKRMLNHTHRMDVWYDYLPTFTIKLSQM